MVSLTRSSTGCYKTCSLITNTSRIISSNVWLCTSISISITIVIPAVINCTWYRITVLFAHPVVFRWISGFTLTCCFTTIWCNFTIIKVNTFVFFSKWYFCTRSVILGVTARYISISYLNTIIWTITFISWKIWTITSTTNTIIFFKSSAIHPSPKEPQKSSLH